jgi:hypothetical protein
MDNLCQVLVESFAVNERMSQSVLEQLDPAAWRRSLQVPVLSAKAVYLDK